MKKFIRHILRSFFLSAILIFSSGIAWAEVFIKDVSPVDVTPSGFSIIWESSINTTPGITLFSDPDGLIDVTNQLEVTSFPLYGGDPAIAGDYEREKSMDNIRSKAKSYGLMKIRVEGALPDTQYYYRISSEVGGIVATWPAVTLSSVKTTIENSFVAESKQMLLTISAQGISEGWIVKAFTSETLFGVSAFVGDGASANQAYIDLNNLFGQDGTNWSPSGSKEINVEVLRGSGNSKISQTFSLDFTGMFNVSTLNLAGISDIIMTTSMADNIYAANEESTVDVNITNLSSSLTYTDTKLSVELIDQAGNITLVSNETIPSILPASDISMPIKWNTLSRAPGEYDVAIKLTGGNQVIAESTEIVNITPTLSINGKLNLNQTEVIQGAPLAIGYELTNNGNVVTGPGEVNLIFIKADNSEAARYTQSLDTLSPLIMVAQTVNIANINMDGGIYKIKLEVNLSGNLFQIAEESLTVSRNDIDSDGVLDVVDNCPGVANSNQLDFDMDGTGDSCDGDQDNDGVIGIDDVCANTLLGEPVDAQGCSANQKDSDTDGINDAIDLCPNTPANAEVSPDGCSAGQLNFAPVANAGADQNVITGNPVTLNGSASSDADGDTISFKWRFIEIPAGSVVTDLSLTPDKNSIMPSFTADINGRYILELIVNDGLTDSQPDYVDVMSTTLNVAPNADAGVDQNVFTGSTVLLDGSGTRDPDNAPYALTYSWSFVSVPVGSLLTNDNIVGRYMANASFIPDQDGLYIMRLEASDALAIDTDEVVVGAEYYNAQPNANAGADISVNSGTLVTLDGRGSNDPDNRPFQLTYQWSFVSLPAGSLLTDNSISNSNTENPSFTPDITGDYLIQLTVSDGQSSSTDNVVVVAKLAVYKANSSGSSSYFSELGLNAYATFAVERTSGNPATGNLTFNSSKYRRKIVSTGISSLTVTGKTGIFSGTCTMNGIAGYSFTATAADNATPGSGADTFSISVAGPNGFKYTASGIIVSGNYLVSE